MVAENHKVYQYGVITNLLIAFSHVSKANKYMS